ncbi:MAG: ATP-binding protein [Pseudorhodobacter sp.]|nr:ATP-binding protein [Pseudorhodobacter sp.]
MIRRIVPQSVGGQLLALLLLAIALTQGLSLIVLSDERNRAVRAAIGLEAAGRAANVALLLEDAPADLQPSILRSADSPLVRFQIGQTPETTHDSADSGPFLDRLRQILGAGNEGGGRDIHADIHVRGLDPAVLPDSMPAAMRPMHQAMMLARTEKVEMTLSIPLANGDWLNVRSMFQRPGPQLTPEALLPLLLMAIAVALVAWITGRRIVGPMRVLATGADRLGRGLDAGPLPLTGPAEVRETTLAFNRMQERLTRFVADRTRMLAALSHDLRSPLTAMRLRIEMLDEDDDSIRLKALVAEMQAMVEATLDFARGAATQEAAVPVDLAVLLADLVGDAAAGEGQASLIAPQPVLATVRPTPLKRALRNLIDNAIRYGDRAQVMLTQQPGMAIITIADDGPGLPEDQLVAVFEPFRRLETSRSRDTGGVGLGLAIARTIVQAHGGNVTLANRPEGGLQATVRLPVDPA